MTSRRRVVSLLLAGVIAAPMGYGMSNAGVPVETASVSQGALQGTITAHGRCRVSGRHTIASPAAGQLERIRFRPGDTVQRGSVIATVTPSASPLLDARSRAQSELRLQASDAAYNKSRADVERLRVVHEQASRELDRVRTLAKKDVVTERDLENAEATARGYAAEMESARQAILLAKVEREMARAVLSPEAVSPRAADKNVLEIKTPVSGSVLRLFQSSEGIVAPGTPLLEVGDLSTMEVAVDLLTSEALQVRAGSSATLQVPGSDASLNARVRVVEPAAFTKVSALGVEEQRVTVILDPVDQNPVWKNLGDGFHMEVGINVWDAANVMKVPTSSTFRYGKGWGVFVVRRGRATLRAVEIGRNNGTHAEVLKGLESNDEVIVHPSDKLNDGSAVETP